jgi:hypothetical protein
MSKEINEGTVVVSRCMKMKIFEEMFRFEDVSETYLT